MKSNTSWAQPYQLMHTLQGHAHPIYCLEKGPGPSSFFSAGGDKMVIHWDLTRLNEPMLLARTPASVYALCYIPNTNWLAIGQAEGGIHLIDLQSRTEFKYWKFHTQGVFSLQYHEATHSLWASAADGFISGWNLNDLTFIKSLDTHAEKVRALAMHPTKPMMAAACSDTTIRLYAIPDGRELAVWPAHTWAVNCVLWDVDGKLWSASRDAHLRVWDAESGNLLNSWAIHNYAVYQLAFSPNHTQLATASRDKSIKIWEHPDLKPVQKLVLPHIQGHTHSVNAVIWHPFQHRLISASDDHTLKIWGAVNEL